MTENKPVRELKVFSVDEANLLIPLLTEKLKELQGLKTLISRREAAIDALEMISEPGSGGVAPEVGREIKAYQGLLNRYYEGIENIHAMGCFLKDVEIGLVDVYGRHNGRIVHYCWRLGEKSIAYWHDVGRGYRHRQPLKQNSADGEN